MLERGPQVGNPLVSFPLAGSSSHDGNTLCGHIVTGVEWIVFVFVKTHVQFKWNGGMIFEELCVRDEN